MKKTKLFAAAVAMLSMPVFMSCSNDEPANVDNQDTTGDSYICVKLSNLPDFTSRAGDEGASFDEGTDNERYLRNIAFYFFNADGSAFTMENNNINGTLTPSNKVKPVMSLSSSNSYTATLVLGKAVGSGWNGTVPAKMVAIANSANLDGYANLSLDELYAKVAMQPEDLGSKGYFAMTSSTYSPDGTNIKYWSDIKLENVKKDPEDAKAAPVKIYLERLAAKVQVVSKPAEGKANEKGHFVVATRPVYDAEGHQVTKTFYAKINGWDLNATTDRAFVFKNIDKDNVPFTGWNLPESFRSCWATTTGEAELSTKFNWSSLSNEFGDVDYCYENTLEPAISGTQLAATKATKVLLAATIVDESGTAQDLVSWAGTLYTTDDFRTMVANHVECDAADVKFVRSTEVNKRHHVATYYTKDGEDIAIPEFDNIRVWNKGVCYYIVNLRHAVDANGKNVYGVVRNHSYVVSINSIAGLGTPGGSGDHENPENPDPELESFVAAQVNILNWHVINWDVDVES